MQEPNIMRRNLILGKYDSLYETNLKFIMGIIMMMSHGNYMYMIHDR
jgi:hypothetical protein